MDIIKPLPENKSYQIHVNAMFAKRAVAGMWGPLEREAISAVLRYWDVPPVSLGDSVKYTSEGQPACKHSQQIAALVKNVDAMSMRLPQITAIAMDIMGEAHSICPVNRRGSVKVGNKIIYPQPTAC